MLLEVPFPAAAANFFHNSSSGYLVYRFSIDLLRPDLPSIYDSACNDNGPRYAAPDLDKELPKLFFRPTPIARLSLLHIPPAYPGIASISLVERDVSVSRSGDLKFPWNIGTPRFLFTRDKTTLARS